MKLSELNESLNFNVSSKGIVVYLDKENKTFRIAQDKETEQLERRGLTHTIASKDDYRKVARKYDIDVSMEDWVKISNEAKKQNKDTEFRKALAAMQADISRMSKKRK